MSYSYLQSNDTLTSLDLLIVKMSSLFVCIFHANVNFCVHTFGLCLRQKTHAGQRADVTFVSFNNTKCVCQEAVNFGTLYSLTMLARASSVVWT